LYLNENKLAIPGEDGCKYRDRKALRPSSPSSSCLTFTFGYTESCKQTYKQKQHTQMVKTRTIKQDWNYELVWF